MFEKFRNSGPVWITLLSLSVAVICLVTRDAAQGINFLNRANLGQSARADTTKPGDKRSGKIYIVPASITADGSRAVEEEIMRFIATVPDGATVKFPAKGVYGQNRTILIADRKNLTIDGNGATFKSLLPPHKPDDPKLSNANWRVAGGDGVTLKNLIIRGSYVPPTRGTPGQGQFTDHGVSLWGAVNVSVLNCRIYNVDGEFVTADTDIRKGTDYTKNPPCRNVLIDRLVGAHASRQGVASTASDGFTISNSTISDCQQNGIDIEIDAPGELNRNIKILNNTFDGVYFTAIAVPVGSFPGHEDTVGNIEIRGNVLKRAPDTCWPAIYVNDNRATINNLTIANNTLLTISDGIRLTNVASGSVSDNTIIKTTDNTGCYNPNFNPPYNVPVRRDNSTVKIERNAFKGFPEVKQG